jgi:hypothetical protein
VEVFLTNKEIQAFIKEPKYIDKTFQEIFTFKNWKHKKGHKEFDYSIERNDGSSFIVKIRLNNENQLDFSVILIFNPANTNHYFILRRYNGKSHEHKNTIEGAKFYDFHIHKATERYQNEGRKAEHFAEPTNSYNNVKGAMRQFIEDCNVTLKENPQLEMKI